VLGQLVSSGDYPALSAVPADVVRTLEQASAEAFMVGMDRAIIFSTVGIIAAAIVSYFLIDDAVVEKPIEEQEAAEAAIRAGDVDFSPTAAD
jgi:hypothetical protein